MRILLLLLPCAWALTIPPQPALVCPDLFNYYPDLISYLSGFLLGGTQPDTADYSKMYCSLATQVICTPNIHSDILNPSFIIPSAHGSFRGAGMNFDVYSTSISDNFFINMQNLSCYYQNTCNNVLVNGASLDFSNQIPITSSDAALAVDTAHDYYGIYYSSPTKLVLFYPANLAFNASGINCNQALPVNGTPPIATTAPFQTTPAPTAQAPATVPAPPPAPSPSTTDNTNTIVGAVVGTVIGLLVLIALFFLVKHFAPTPLESRYPPTPYTPLGVRYQPVPYYHPMR